MTWLMQNSSRDKTLNVTQTARDARAKAFTSTSLAGVITQMAALDTTSGGIATAILGKSRRRCPPQ